MHTASFNVPGHNRAFRKCWPSPRWFLLLDTPLTGVSPMVPELQAHGEVLDRLVRIPFHEVASLLAHSHRSGFGHRFRDRPICLIRLSGIGVLNLGPWDDGLAYYALLTSAPASDGPFSGPRSQSATNGGGHGAEDLRG